MRSSNVKPASVLSVADLWAKCCSSIRAPKAGSLRTSTFGSSSNMLLLSFATEGRSAGGTANSETVSCVFDLTQKKTVSVVTNPTTAAVGAPFSILASSSPPDESFALRLSSSPKPTAFRCTVDVFSTNNNNNQQQQQSFIVTDGTTGNKHGELLQDAHLQQLCFDKGANSLFFVVKSNPAVAARQSLEEVVAGALDKCSKNEGASVDWQVSGEPHNLGEAYPNICGTEIVRVQLPSSSSSASSTSSLLKTEKAIFPEATSSSTSSSTTTSSSNNNKDDSTSIASTTNDNFVYCGSPCSIGNDAIAFLAYDVDHPYRGLVHCFAARPNRQFVSCFKTKKTTEIKLGDNVKQLSSSPFNPLQIAYFDFIPSVNRPFGRRPHLACAALCLAELCPSTYELKSKKILVDIIRSSSSSSSSPSFPGFYPVFGNGDLIWLDETTLLVSSVRNSAHVLYTVSTKTKGAADDGDHASPTLITSSYGTWKFMSSVSSSPSQNFIIAQHSSTTTAPCLRLIDLSNNNNNNNDNNNLSEKQFPIIFVDSSNNNNNTYNNSANSLLLAEASQETIVLPLNSAGKLGEILFHKSSRSLVAQKQKCVVFSHGGPHSTDVNSYARSHHLLLAAGFDILSINYRGSLGFGQDGVESLIGHAGQMEIDDILAAIEQCQQFKEQDEQEQQQQQQQQQQAKPPLISPDADLFLSGGSHGGFTSCILSAKKTLAGKKFKAAAIRNPVTDIPAMRFATDIGDWCLTEGGVEDPESDGTEIEARKKMTALNPILTASRVEIPCLVGIGCGDLRVPPFQGRSWANAVRFNKFKPEVQVVEFEKDNHGLDSPTTESEFAIQTVMFFNKYSSS